MINGGVILLYFVEQPPVDSLVRVQSIFKCGEPELWNSTDHVPQSHRYYNHTQTNAFIYCRHFRKTRTCHLFFSDVKSKTSPRSNLKFRFDKLSHSTVSVIIHSSIIIYTFNFMYFYVWQLRVARFCKSWIGKSFNKKNPSFVPGSLGQTKATMRIRYSLDHCVVCVYLSFICT